jgi:choline dehydrogenase-like flavoprotein
MTAWEYDYIIVGGGSAGCVLAARLSEDRDAKVLLIEAGGNDRHFLFHWPAGFSRMTKGIASWGWSTVPQKHLQDRVLWYTQAKVIGGGSSINAQIYTRGNALDYDNWAQAGCTGWSYREVLPYFRKAEDNDTFDNEWHGKGGPLGVSQPADLRSFHTGGWAIGPPAQQRSHQAGPHGFRLLPTHPEACQAFVDGRCLSQTGDEPAQPHCHVRGNGGARRRRRFQGHWCRGQA